MHALQGQQHYSQDEVDSTLVAQQHELLLTQQAFHAKQLQLEGGHELHCSSVQVCAGCLGDGGLVAVLCNVLCVHCNFNTIFMKTSVLCIPQYVLHITMYPCYACWCILCTAYNSCAQEMLHPHMTHHTTPQHHM